ncbi:MAG TPA: OmpA family protein [Polyangiaceae bacterium]|nr:OmpA family protein [Polyangiaceae bacterium]
MTSLSLLVLLGAVACGATPPPPELVDARKAYERASKGLAAQLAPAQLDTAKQALAKAESSFEEEGVDPPTPDLAYIAERKAMIAEATAGKVAAERDSGQADKQFKDAQLEGLDKTQAALSKEKQQSEKTKAELENERKARAEAEKRAAAAMASLQEIAKVKEEARGMVITLSGSVLFATGKYELLPIAREKLDEVAKALKDQGYKQIIVEGHTDSRGKASDNDTLSLKRAESVRTHLVSQGIPSDKIRATGLGSGRSIADNNTAEGRANNRRVEIVVEPLGK